MEGKDSVCKILRSIMGVEISMNSQLLIDYVMGNPTQKITKCGLDNTEEFGCGDDKDEEHWNMVIDKVAEAGYIKGKTVGYSVTVKGKKYLKNPTSFELTENDEDDEEQVGNIDGFVDSILNDNDTIAVTKPAPKKQTTSARKMAIIQAIDRHVALDDFANNHGLDFDEVLTDVEGILANGTKLDLNYFGEEVLGDEALDELFAYYDEAESDNLNKAFDEYGDVYSMDELRIGRILWRVNKM